MNLTELFKVTSPSVVGFISKLANTPVGSTPHFPPIFGTGFFIDSGHCCPVKDRTKSVG
jgi:hypothetical protein